MPFGGGFGPPPWMGYGAPVPAGDPVEQELQFLKGQAEYFEDVLDGIKKRIEELEAMQKGE